MFSQNDNYNNKNKNKKIEHLKMKNETPTLLLTQNAFPQRHLFFFAIYFWALNALGMCHQARSMLVLQHILKVSL